MKTRTSKTMGIAAALAAIAVSVPLAVTAQADPTPTVDVKPPPDPQGPGCGAVNSDLAAKGLNWAALNGQPVGKVLSEIPSISTFNSAVSGGLNPAVNIIPVLENGPYVVFAPTNDAFAALEPGQLDALKGDVAGLTSLDYYHVFLGILGNEDLKGTRPSQQGTDITVKNGGGDIIVNGEAKLVCGALFAQNARIYIIDKVLDKTTGAAASEAARGATSLSTTPTTTSSATSSPEPAPAPAG